MGIPAFFVVYLAPDYIENWRSADERAEQKELYSIIGDQDVIRIATKHIGGNVVCLDPYNDQKLKVKLSKFGSNKSWTVSNTCVEMFS